MFNFPVEGRMGLVSLSSDIEERREAALAEISRLKAEIELAGDSEVSGAHLLRARCDDILSAVQHLAEKMYLGPDDIYQTLTELELRRQQAEARADALQLRLDEDRHRTDDAVTEAKSLADQRYRELTVLRQRAKNDAERARLRITDLSQQVTHWRKVASGEVLHFKPGPRTPQPGKPYRKAPGGTKRKSGGRKPR